MKRIAADEAKQLIHATNGRIFSARFRKKDGTIRDMVCRLGVKSKLKGGKRRYNPADYNLVCVYDMQKEGYRSIPFARLTNLTVDGTAFEVLTQD